MSRLRLWWMARHKDRPDRSAGFTLVELLLAMALFSFVLLIVVLGVVALIGVYQTGVADRRSQNGARVAMNQIVGVGRQALSFTYSGSGNNFTICTYGPQPTVFYLGGVTNDRLMQQVWDQSGNCGSANGSGPVVNVTPSDIAVVKLQAEQTDNYDNASGLPKSCASAGACRTLRIDITTTTNKAGLDATNSFCTASANFCSVTSISSSVRGRTQS